MKKKKQRKRLFSAALAVLMLFTCVSSSSAALKAVLVGDVDQDGKITAGDARMALRFAVTLDQPQAMDTVVCDIDGDGKISAGDARMVLRVAVGIDDLQGRIAGVKLEPETTTEPPTTQPPTTQPPTTQPPTTQPPTTQSLRSIDEQAITGDRYLGTQEMRVNAKLVYQFLSAKGWSKNAICGVLGNMELESTMNPGLYERGGSGFGLVQWTPGSMYRNWADSHGYRHDSVVGQLTYLIYTMDPNSGCPNSLFMWFPSIAPSSYRESYSSFIHSSANVGYLAMVFMHCYERPGVKRESKRMAAAERWYSYFS